MGRRIVPITTRNLDELPWPCRDCAFWETGPAQHLDRAASTRGGAPAKATWVERTTAEWGSCGQLAYVDDVPAGYVTYAPPAFVPRASAFPTSPVSADAVLLMTARIAAPFAGTGLGRVLVQAAAKDLSRRGVRAIEAYGAIDEGCVLPVDYL